ncbi:MAG: 6,7-dimethyl-8-ribityllumazine synthase [Gemmataceae bacterium]
MPQEIEGSWSAVPGRWGLVASRTNRLVVEGLVHGAVDALRRAGIADEAIDLIWVPGSFEIPQAARVLAASGRYRALVCLGAVLRGETEHHEHIAAQAIAGVEQAAVATGVPMTLGILTCDTLEQALHRAGGKGANKGAEAALAALEMAQLFARLPGGSP